jgi:hypothetical protein
MSQQKPRDRVLRILQLSITNTLVLLSTILLMKLSLYIASLFNFGGTEILQQVFHYTKAFGFLLIMFYTIILFTIDLIKHVVSEITILKKRIQKQSTSKNDKNASHGL